MFHHPNYGSNVTPPDDNSNNNDTDVVPNTIVQKPILTSSCIGTTSSATTTATATRTVRRRFLLAGGVLIGTTCTVTFGLLLKGHELPMTSLLHSSGLDGGHSCCAVDDRDYCEVVDGYNGKTCQRVVAADGNNGKEGDCFEYVFKGVPCPRDSSKLMATCQSVFGEDGNNGKERDCFEYVFKGDPCIHDGIKLMARICKTCYFDGGLNGPRCCTEKDHKTWYPLALHPKCH